MYVLYKYVYMYMYSMCIHVHTLSNSTACTCTVHTHAEYIVRHITCDPLSHKASLLTTCTCICSVFCPVDHARRTSNWHFGLLLPVVG